MLSIQTVIFILVTRKHVHVLFPLLHRLQAIGRPSSLQATRASSESQPSGHIYPQTPPKHVCTLLKGPDVFVVGARRISPLLQALFALSV